VSQKMIRIANAGGYWGDDPYALRRQIRGSLALNYITIDFLAEITMSILQKQRSKDPRAGFARDFITQVEPLLKELKDKGIRIITNAGGVNPRACAEELCLVAKKQGLKLKVAVVEGDDIQPSIADLYTKQGVAFLNMETGEDFSKVLSKTVASNVYFGALPVVEALKFQPDIVICGRVTDTGITTAALVHEFGWSATDYDKLAHGIVASHLIECGAQATGGNFSDWKKVKSFENMGYPIVECMESGEFFLTKHPEQGGFVSAQTAREQLLYEMGEPQAYLTPDVIADFSTIQLEDATPGRVRVWGVKGSAPTDLLKVSIAYQDGYKTSGAIIISGPDALPKAKLFESIFWQKLDQEILLAGIEPIVHRHTEFIGSDSTHGPLTPGSCVGEVLLKFSAGHSSKEPLGVFRKLLPALILSGPSGVAVTGGAPIVSEVVSYWPALMPQQHSPAQVLMIDDKSEMKIVKSNLQWPVTLGVPPASYGVALPNAQTFSGCVDFVKVPLALIAHARSGDKGDTSNIGLIGRSQKCYEWLALNVEAAMVKTWFSWVCKGRVTRHLVPGLWALNFLLEESLDGGGTMSLYTDAQGKTLSQALLRCEVNVPRSLLQSIAARDLCPPGELSAGLGDQDRDQWIWSDLA
jgi:hypothetical protein